MQPPGTGFPPARLAQIRQAYPVFRIEDAQATVPGEGVLRIECRFTCGAHVFRPVAEFTGLLPGETARAQALLA